MTARSPLHTTYKSREKIMFRFRDFKSLFPYFLLALAVIAAYYAIGEIKTMLNFIGSIFGWIWNVITPFFYGFIIAYILHMPFDGLQKVIGRSKNGVESKFRIIAFFCRFVSKRKKAISLVILLILLALIIFVISYLIIPTVYSSIMLFLEELPSYYNAAVEWLEHVNNLEQFVRACVTLDRPGAPLFFTTLNKTYLSKFFAIYLAEVC